MEKLQMKSRDAVEGNIAKIATIFPHCVTERINKNGKSELAIDFDKLRSELSKDVLEEGEERYQFTWPDKRAASRLANTAIDKTLRPDLEASKDFWNTENLYIEGDNLDVLKVLRENYLGKIKMIYIDPPYNTGNDFVFNDDFAQSRDEFELSSGLFDEDSNQVLDPMQRNTESNGRFHTDWLNMIYPRLKVARDLLSDDGVIFISIDDNEQENLRKVCDEVFGGQNFIAQLIWERAFAPKNDAKFISNSHDYVVMYARNINIFKIGRLPRTAEADARYSNPDNDPRGVWQSDNLTVKTYSPSGDYPITTPSGRVVEPPAGRCWRLSAKAFAERLQDNRIWFGSDGNGVPRIKRFLSELKFEGMAPTSILYYKEVGHSQEGSQEVNKLMDAGVFDGPKPQRLMERLLTLANLDEDSIVLDFFSGSGSMGHAVMKYNAEKGKHCKFILVQLPEETDDKAKKVGYENICQIGEERIRRAGERIINECRDAILRVPDDKGNSNLENLFGDDTVGTDVSARTRRIASLPDVGFRVLKLDSSNMEDVFYTPEDFNEKHLFNYVDNVKSDRTPLDLLFQVLPELGIELSAKIEERDVNGKKVFFVDGTYLIATFDTEVNESTVTEIAKMKPDYFVMRDASAANDNVLDNFEQIFKHYSPDTIRKIL
ncbi:MAG: site-specific DNA-methyltransferase [Muribaculaceae bacterium]|nr:site-specific DNA-methyltransferase [Muribaculaceae bacterium]